MKPENIKEASEQMDRLALTREALKCLEEKEAGISAVKLQVCFSYGKPRSKSVPIVADDELNWAIHILKGQEKLLLDRLRALGVNISTLEKI